MADLRKQPSWPWVAPRFIPTKCAVCRQCFLDKATGCCVYGGGYVGYLPPAEQPRV